MAMLPTSAYTLYKKEVLSTMETTLVGTTVVAQAESVPPGTSRVNQDTRVRLKGKAKRGAKGSPIPRETGGITPGTIYIPEIAHGFDLHRKDLQASQNAGVPLPTQSANDSTRLVAEAIEEMIFLGDADFNIKGIYADAGKSYTVEEGYEWNSANANPLSDVVGMCSELRSTGLFKQKKLVLSPNAYMSMFDTNIVGLSHIKQIAELFPNGLADIVEAPPTTDGTTEIIPEDGGVLCDFGNRIAERIVEEEINLQSDFEMNTNQMYSFNIVTYQTLKINEVNAYVKLDNLIDPALNTP